MKIGDIAFRNLSSLGADLKRMIESPNTLRVSADADAVVVANSLGDEFPGVILLHRPGHPEIAESIVAPEWLRQLLIQRKKYDPGITLAEALGRMRVDPDEIVRKFRHEWLSDVPNLHYCAKHDHYVRALPCRLRSIGHSAL
jgi:hypothetical protein